MTWLLSHRYVRYDNQNELKTMKKHINNYPRTSSTGSSYA